MLDLLSSLLIYFFFRYISVQFSHAVVSDSLPSHGLQQPRLPCPSPTPGVCCNPCPWSQWCHPTTSSSVVPSSPCLQSFPESGSFPMSQFFASGGQSIEASASASVLPMCFNFMAAVTICSNFGAPGNKVCHCFHCFSIYLQWSERTRCHEFCFWLLNFKPAFSLSFIFIKTLFSFSLHYAIKVDVWSYWYFSQQSWFQLVLHPVQYFTWCTLYFI